MLSAADLKVEVSREGYQKSLPSACIITKRKNPQRERERGKFSVNPEREEKSLGKLANAFSKTRSVSLLIISELTEACLTNSPASHLRIQVQFHSPVNQDITSSAKNSH